MPVLTVEKPLQKVLGDVGVDSLIKLLNQSQKEQKQHILEFVEDKFERRLTEEIFGVKEKITEEISGVNERITKGISGMNDRITKEISGVNERMTQMEKNLLVNDQKIHSKLLIWMFVFWITQIGTIAGLIIAFLK
ncbi:hypothetical protein H8E88_18795 [candidate division KSB1 bacterium]|nr:hypothetical protein [candidate division KSB1 bacterium]MBL7093336.1 hypothetical protein [candidate division KSB1 bacterium]